MLLSVLIPTLAEREAELFQVTAAYLETVPGCEVLTVMDRSWGFGCNELAEQAQGEYLLFGTDDTVPFAGWFEAGRELVDAGLTPASRYLHPDGSPLHERDTRKHLEAVEWTRSWLITPERFREIGPMIDTTWWADIDYSERMAAAGYAIVGCDGFAWTHLDTARDWLTPEEHDRQRALYDNRASGLASVVPWEGS